jgi:argininosuccinate lyase
MAGVVGTLKANAPLMAHRTSLGFTQATDLADEITLTTGLSYKAAHHVVGHLVSLALDRGLQAKEITAELVDEAALAVLGHPLNLPPATLAQALDARAVVASRRGLGGAALGPMQAMIAECRQLVADEQRWRERVEHRLATAETDLVHLARELAAGSRRSDHAAASSAVAGADEPAAERREACPL